MALLSLEAGILNSLKNALENLQLDWKKVSLKLMATFKPYQRYMELLKIFNHFEDTASLENLRHASAGGSVVLSAAMH